MMLTSKKMLIFLSVYALLGIIALAPVATVSASGEQFQLKWAIESSTVPSLGWGIAVKGNTVFVAGSAFNGQTGVTNVLLEAYNTKGQYLWQTLFGGSNECVGTAISTSLGGLFVVGNTVNNGNPDKALLVKFSNDGQPKWSKTWGVGLADAATAIAVTYDAVYVVGYSMTPSGYLDIFLSKFSIFGTCLWTKTWGGSYDDVPSGVAVDLLSNVYVVGLTNTTEYGGTQGFLLKFNCFGSLKDSTSWGRIYDFATAVAIDGNRIYVSGGSLIGFNLQAVLIAFDKNLDEQWSTSWGDEGEDIPTNIAIGTGDRIYVVGVTTSFGTGDWDSFLLKFNSKGSAKSSTSWGNAGLDDFGNGIAVDCGIIYVAGYTNYQLPILTLAAFRS
ncbi:MAG: SBBP repeat-containing protein [Candidatus Methanomethylicus sp.]|nr:SBBP repeat-containing protein [Candidatus Methanomethylicus sp.]